MSISKHLTIILNIFSFSLFSNNLNNKYLYLIPESSTSPHLRLFNPKNPESLSPNFLSTLANLTQATTFCESGTAFGHTTENAAKIYKEIYTTEISASLFIQAKDYLKKYNNVHIFHGDSSELFPKILPYIKDKTLFWLDGHYSGGPTEKGKMACPIWFELDAIKKNKITNSVIAIDDIRTFYEFMRAEGYPPINELINKIREINPNYKFIVFGDILLCITNEKITISPLLKACTISRIYDGSNFNIEDVLEAEDIIAKSIGEEGAMIDYLFNKFVVSFGQKHIKILQHFPLWQGLRLMENKQYQQAYYCFKESEERGLNHWRVQWYIAQTLFHLNYKSQAKQLLYYVTTVSNEYKPALNLLSKIN